MKKASKCVSLLLLSLFLASCNRNSDVSERTSEQPSESVSDTSESADSESVFVPDSTPISETDNPSESVTTPIDTSQEHYREMWSDAIADQMIEYLEYIIPYFDIGVPQANFVNEEDGYLLISGTKKINSKTVDEWDSAISEAYLADNWTLEGSIETQITIARTDLSITLTVTADELGIYIKARYEEVFDETVLTAWPNDIKDELNARVDNHEIPFVYLGNKKPYILDGSTSAYDFRICGGKWDDRVNALFTKAFDESWTKNSDTEYQQSYEDGCTLIIALAKSSTKSDAKAVLTVKLTHSYDITESTGEYDEDTKNAMIERFGRVAPYVYLGTNTLVASTSNSGKAYIKDQKLLFKGGDWDASCLDIIYNSLQKDYSEYSWTYTETIFASQKSRIFIGTNEYNDEWRIHVRGSSKVMYGEFTYREGYDKNRENSTWRSSVLDMLSYHDDDKTGEHSHSIPYFYTGTIGEETVTARKGNIPFDEYTFLSCAFNFDILLDCKTALENDSENTWNIVLNYADYELNAKTTFSDGCVIEVTLSLDTTYDRLEFNLKTTYKLVESEETGWSEKCSSDLAKVSEHQIPYIYLNKEGVTSSYSSTSDKTTITGGVYKEAVYTNFENIYSQNGFTVTDTSTKSKRELTAEKTEDDFCLLIVKVYNNINSSTGNPSGKIYLTYEVDTSQKPYSKPEDGAYTQEAKDLMTANLHEELPYIYLGVDDETVVAKYTSSKKQLSLSSNSANTCTFELLADAKTTLINAGYSARETTTKYGDGIEAYKDNQDGSQIRLVVGSFSTTKRVELHAYYSEASDYAQKEKQEYSQDILNEMNSSLKNHTLPALYLDSPTTNKLKVSSSSINRLTLQATKKNWNNNYYFTMKEELEQAGYSCTLDLFGSNDESSSCLTASKADSTGLLTFAVSNNSSYIYVCSNFNPNYIAPEKREYSQTIQDSMSENLGVIVPYIHLGNEEDMTFKGSEGKVTITCNSFDEKVFQDAIDNTPSNWSYYYDYTSSKGKTLVLSAVVNEKHLTLKLYGTSTNTSTSLYKTTVLECYAN